MPCEVISLTVQTTISPGSGILPCSEVIIENSGTLASLIDVSPDQSSFFTTVPRILAFPPMLSTSFLPHALQPTSFVEDEKTTRSSPQSGHFTWRKLLLGLGMGSLLFFTRLSPPFSALFPFS